MGLVTARLLALVCIEEARRYEPDEFGAKMIELIIAEESRATLEGLRARRLGRKVLRAHRVMPNATPVLILEKLIR